MLQKQALLSFLNNLIFLSAAENPHKTSRERTCISFNVRIEDNGDVSVIEDSDVPRFCRYYWGVLMSFYPEILK